MSSLRRNAPLLLLLVAGSMVANVPRARAQWEDGQALVPIERFELANGMTFLVVNRPNAVSVSAGWVAGVGSAYDPEGRTGLSHLLEHMMFKGTRTLGTMDLERDLALLDQEDRLWEEILALEASGTPSDTAEASRKRKELDRLIVRGRRVRRSGELEVNYASAGATGLNAVTELDTTAYFVTLPPEKLELWFWLESDRLYQPVFREFHVEKQVAMEERRLRIESTPTGKLEEELQARLWGSHPYGRPGVGRPRDLERLGRPDARGHFEAHYSPSNLTAVLVGPLDADRVRVLAESYFSRIARRPVGAPLQAPTEPLTPATVAAECDCRPQARVLYRVPGLLADSSPLFEMLAALLNGRTGRLHTSLVLEQGIAFSAYAQYAPLAQGGVFTLVAESKAGTTPEALLEALDRELKRLVIAPISILEVERVRNQLRAGLFRRLKDPSQVMMELLLLAGKGEVDRIERWEATLSRTNPPDLQRVARRYLDPEHRVVGLFSRMDAAEVSTVEAPKEFEQ